MAVKPVDVGVRGRLDAALACVWVAGATGLNGSRPEMNEGKVWVLNCTRICGVYRGLKNVPYKMTFACQHSLTYQYNHNDILIVILTHPTGV